MDHLAEHPFSWTQPPGRWQARGADLPCLRLACGIAPGIAGDELVDADGYTLWHYWAHGPAPQELISHMSGVDRAAYRNALSKDGEHPLHRLAAGGRHQALLAWEEAYGKEPWTGAINRHGDNILASAIWSGDEATALWAISRGVGELDNTDASGLTPLIVAVERGNEKILEALLGSGADPAVVDFQGRSALHHAASRGREEMFVLLEDAGCDPEEKDKSGARAIDILAKAAKSENSRVLEQHWARRAAHRLDF